MNEIWKDIVGYEGLYQVSNLGRVKSLIFGKEKILKPGNNKYGYYKVNLYKAKVKTFHIHKLVAMTFLHHTQNDHKLVVDHINANKLDNRVENLQIISQRHNTSKDKKNKTSKYTGVCWDKYKWKSAIRINGKKKHLGVFNCETKAGLVYLQAVKELEQKKGRN